MASSIHYDADEALTVSNSSVGITVGTALNSDRAFITCETASVRFRLDSSAASASVGHILAPGDVLILDSRSQIAAFRAFRKDATDATLSISLGKEGGQ